MRLPNSLRAMKSITVHELHRLLSQVPSPTLLDVRTPSEFSEVHIPGVIGIPLDELTPEAVVRVGGTLTGGPLYLVCHSGNRAAKAGEKIARLGITDGVVVEGGIQAWIAAGYPVIRSGLKVISLERQVRIVAGALVLTGVLFGTFLHPGFFGLSGFVGAGLLFAGVTDFCGMGLLLARLPYNQRKALPRSSAE